MCDCKTPLIFSPDLIADCALRTGVSTIEFALSTAPEVIVSVRGKDKFVVMNIAHYHYLRECELDAALAETRADVAAGRVVQESPAAHLARLEAL